MKILKTAFLAIIPLLCLSWAIQAGEVRIEKLIELLDSRDAGTRAAAAEMLGQTNDPRAIKPLVAAALKDSYSGVRNAAAASLAKIKDRSIGPLLIAALKDEKPDIRSHAAQALRKSNETRAVRPLIAALKDSDAKVQCSAAQALGNLSDQRAVRPLVASLKNPRRAVQGAAVMALIGIGKPAVTALITTLGDEDPVVRKYSAVVLGEIRDPQAVRPLIAVLKKTGEELEKIEEEKITRPGIQSIKENLSKLRLAAAKALGQLKDPRAVETLIDALQYEKPTVHPVMVWALQRITGEKFGKDRAEWRTWWQENKKRFPRGG